MTNCINCGAPIYGNKCEYCGTEYGNFISEKAIYLLSIFSHGIKAEWALDLVGLADYEEQYMDCNAIGT